LKSCFAAKDKATKSLNISQIPSIPQQKFLHFGHQPPAAWHAHLTLTHRNNQSETTELSKTSATAASKRKKKVCKAVHHNFTSYRNERT